MTWGAKKLRRVIVSKALAGFHVGLHVFRDELRVRFFELDLGAIDIPGIAA